MGNRGSQRANSFDSGGIRFNRSDTTTHSQPSHSPYQNYSDAISNLSNGMVNANAVGKSPISLNRRKKFHSTDSLPSLSTEANIADYGWFEDFESPTLQKLLNHDLAMGSSAPRDLPQQPLHRALTLPSPATEPPLYILESNIETQQLWYSTAGQRPKQPPKEREYFEKLWSANFEQSAVVYNADNINNNNSNKAIPAPNDNGDDFSQNQPPNNNNNNILLANIININRPDIIPRSEFQGDTIFKGKAPFSNSVSKSFFDSNVSSMTIQLPYYRIFSSQNGEAHAEFLVVVTLGTVTFGIWRRHSDFCHLAEKVQEANVKSGKNNAFKNAVLSWQCLLQRQRWFKCLDKDYLSLKCFLLERFMHDLLFESATPHMISEFLGLI
eukprot:gene4406-6232_t